MALTSLFWELAIYQGLIIFVRVVKLVNIFLHLNAALYKLLGQCIVKHQSKGALPSFLPSLIILVFDFAVVSLSVTCHLFPLLYCALNPENSLIK